MKRIACAYLLSLIALSFTALAASAELQRIRFAMPNRGISFFALLAAQNEGYFRDEGLDAQFIIVTPSTSLQALIAGDLQFVTYFSSTSRATLAGAPVRNVMVLIKASNHVMVVRPEIKRMEDLQGKTLGISNLRGLTDVATRLALRKYGVPEESVKFIAVRASATRLAALKGGSIDGSFLPVPYNKMAVKMGFRELIRLRDVVRAPATGLATHVRIIQDSPDLIVRTIKATLRGFRLLKGSKAHFVKLLAKESGIRDKATVDSIHQTAMELYADTGIVSDDVLQEGIALDKKTQGITRDVSLSEVVDFSFARKALQELK